MMKFDFNFKNNRLNILMLVLLALIVRLIALEHIFLISRDGIRFLRIANSFSSGNFFKGLADAYHPLYPFLISLFGGISGNFELTGQFISLALGAFTVIFVYLIGKTIYDYKTGLIGGVFFIMQPQFVKCSVDVLSDTAFLFFLAAACYLAIKGGKEEKKFLWWCFGAGACSGLAYLTRPEGIFVILFFPGWYFLGWILHHQKIRRVLAASGILWCGFFIFAAPYIFFIKNHTGTWHISMKVSVVSMVKPFKETTDEKTGTGKAPSPPVREKNDIRSLPSGSPREQDGAQALAPVKPREPFQGGDIWRSMTYTPLKYIETYHFLLFFFLLFGIRAQMQVKEQASGIILLLFAVIYLLGLCYLYYTVSYVSRRHFFPAILISLPVAGAGFWAIQKQFLKWMTRWNTTGGKNAASHSTVISLLISLLILVPATLGPQGKEKLPLKQAAFWIKENKKNPFPIIMSNEPLVGYYAGGKNLLIPGLSYPDFVQYMDKIKADYLVFSGRDISNGKNFLPLLQPEKFKKAGFKNKQVLVYEISR